MQYYDLQSDFPNLTLSRKELADTPFDQFRIWYEEAITALSIEPNAMALATASSDGKPSCRMVLMKNFDSNGVVFFTNYKSRKAREIESQKYAAATFYWKELKRQVLIEGEVEKTSFAETSHYFKSRLRGSQIGACSSHQDEVIGSRKTLEENYAQLEDFYKDKEIPTPLFWGGFRLRPQRFEFWQERKNRLHDRFQYTKVKDEWKIDRLSP